MKRAGALLLRGLAEGTDVRYPHRGGNGDSVVQSGVPTTSLSDSTPLYSCPCPRGKRVGNDAFSLVRFDAGIVTRPQAREVDDHAVLHQNDAADFRAELPSIPSDTGAGSFVHLASPGARAGNRSPATKSPDLNQKKARNA